MKYIIFHALQATGSHVTDVQITVIDLFRAMIRADQSAMDVEKLIACVFMESGEPGPS
jgi:hypothetical protein